MNDAISLAGWARLDERPFLRRVLDITGTVIAERRWRLTDFLTPREQYLLQSVANHEGVCTAMFGGPEHAERKRALMMPEDWHPAGEDFQITLLFAATLNGADITHGSALGALLGTGLNRRKIGDIYPQDGGVYVAVCDEVAEFLLQEWVQVGRDVIRVEKVTRPVNLLAPRYEDEVVSVSSLRADAVLAQACRWSRSNAQQAILKSMVTLNFTELEKPDVVLDVGDLLSIRGFGRIRLLELQGESRKGRQRVKIGVLRSGR